MVNQWSNTTQEPIYTRNAPCDCVCGDCLRTYVLETPTELSIFADGLCYESRAGAVLLPVGSMIQGNWCIMVTALSGTPFVVTTRVPIDSIYVDGIKYGAVSTTTNMCICWDGKNYVAFGDAHGIIE
jgi:hypothetical protein